MLSLLCAKNPGPPCGVQNPTWPGPVRICPQVPHAEDHTWPGPVWIRPWLPGAPLGGADCPPPAGLCLELPSPFSPSASSLPSFFRVKPTHDSLKKPAPNFRKMVYSAHSGYS